jgi:hypothetical protein
MTLTSVYNLTIMYGIAYYAMIKKNIRELKFQLVTKSPMVADEGYLGKCPR